MSRSSGSENLSPKVLSSSHTSSTSSTSSPLAVLRSFASFANRGSPLGRLFGKAPPQPASEEKNDPQDKENIDVFTSNREPEEKQPEVKSKSTTNSNIFLEMLEKANEEKASKNIEVVKPVELPREPPSRYDAIADLDRESVNEDERWEDRTSVITRWQHEEYVEFASQFVHEMVSKAVSIAQGGPNEYRGALNDTIGSEADSDLDASFQSTRTALGPSGYHHTSGMIGSDESEYESAAETSLVDTGDQQPPVETNELDELIGGLASFQIKSAQKVNETAVSSPFVDPVLADLLNPKPVTLDDSFLAAFDTMNVVSVEPEPQLQTDLDETLTESQTLENEKLQTLKEPAIGKLINLSFGSPQVTKAAVSQPLQSQAYLDLFDVSNTNSSRNESLNLENMPRELEINTLTTPATNNRDSQPEDIEVSQNPESQVYEESLGDFTIQETVTNDSECRKSEVKDEVCIQNETDKTFKDTTLDEQVSESKEMNFECDVSPTNVQSEETVDEISSSNDCKAMEIPIKAETTIEIQQELSIESESNLGPVLHEISVTEEQPQEDTTSKLPAVEPEIVETHDDENLKQEKIVVSHPDEGSHSDALEGVKVEKISNISQEVVEENLNFDENSEVLDQPLPSTNMEEISPVIVQSGAIKDSSQNEAQTEDKESCSYQIDNASETSPCDKNSPPVRDEQLESLPTSMEKDFEQDSVHQEIIVEAEIHEVAKDAENTISESSISSPEIIKEISFPKESFVSEQSQMLQSNSVQISEIDGFEVASFPSELETSNNKSEIDPNFIQSCEADAIEGSFETPSTFSDLEIGDEITNIPCQETLNKSLEIESNSVQSCEIDPINGPSEIASSQSEVKIDNEIAHEPHQSVLDKTFEIQTDSEQISESQRVASPGAELEVNSEIIHDTLTENSKIQSDFEQINETYPQTEDPEVAIPTIESGVSLRDTLSENSEVLTNLVSEVAQQEVPEEPVTKDEIVDVPIQETLNQNQREEHQNCNPSRDVSMMDIDSGPEPKDNDAMDVDFDSKEVSSVENEISELNAAPTISGSQPICQDSLVSSPTNPPVTIGEDQDKIIDLPLVSLDEQCQTSGDATSLCHSTATVPEMNDNAFSNVVAVTDRAAATNTPLVSKVLKKLVESKPTSTPQNDETSSTQPDTPTKKVNSIDATEAENIKRHLFESPLQVNKPMAIVKPSLECVVTPDNKTIAQVTETEIVPDKTQECLEPQKSTDVMEAPIRGGYDLAAILNDPSFNPFETKSTGIRNSFGTSSPPLETTDAVSTVHPNNDSPVIEEDNTEKVPVKKSTTSRNRPLLNRGKPSAETDPVPEGEKKEKKERKPLPPKPWLKKKSSAAQQPAGEDVVEIFMPEKKPASIEQEIQRPEPAIEPSESIPENVVEARSGSPPLPKAKSYNLDFLDRLDDPEFNPFVTKSSVNNDKEEIQPAEVVDELPQLEVIPVPQPDFLNVVKQEPKHLKDSTPEFEAVEKEITQSEKDVRPSIEMTPDVVPKNIKAEEITFDQKFLSKADEFSKNEIFDFNSITAESESFFSIEKPTFLSTSFDPSKSFIEKSNIDMSMTSQKLTFDQNVSICDIVMSRDPLDPIREALARKELLYQAQLLEKDRELHKRERDVQELEKELDSMKLTLVRSNKSYMEMGRVLREYESTISELTSERERERACMEIDKERLIRERDETLSDLRSVERSFSDTHRRYERMKEVIGDFKKNEDSLKATLELVTAKLQRAEERFDRLRDQAQSKLNEANEALATVRKQREGEVAKLQAMIRKAEMRVSMLERTIEEKNHENLELTNICDELIAKVGK